MHIGFRSIAYISCNNLYSKFSITLYNRLFPLHNNYTLKITAGKPLSRTSFIIFLSKSALYIKYSELNNPRFQLFKIRHCNYLKDHLFFLKRDNNNNHLCPSKKIKHSYESF